MLSPIEQSIKNKIEKIGTPLADWNISIYRGISTGYNEAFVIDGKMKDELIKKDPKSSGIIQPMLRGRDIKRYKYDFADLWIITTFPSLNIDIERFSAVKEHLLSFGYDRLKQTGEAGSRKKTNNKWFEAQDSISYWEDFFKQKIVWAELARTGNAFTFDNNGYHLGNTGYFLVMNDEMQSKIGYEYLLAFLNSNAILFYLNIISSRLDETGWRWLRQYVELIPIPIPNNPQMDIITLVKKELEKVTTSGQIELNEIINSVFGFSIEEINYLSNCAYI